MIENEDKPKIPRTIGTTSCLYANVSKHACSYEKRKIYSKASWL